jgi:hypothetical protein
VSLFVAGSFFFAKNSGINLLAGDSAGLASHGKYSGLLLAKASMSLIVARIVTNSVNLHIYTHRNVDYA